jgi:hypothetical protein
MSTNTSSSAARSGVHTTAEPHCARQRACLASLPRVGADAGETNLLRPWRGIHFERWPRRKDCVSCIYGSGARRECILSISSSSFRIRSQTRVIFTRRYDRPNIARGPSRRVLKQHGRRSKTRLHKAPVWQLALGLLPRLWLWSGTAGANSVLVTGGSLGATAHRATPKSIEEPFQSRCRTTPGRICLMKTKPSSRSSAEPNE